MYDERAAAIEGGMHQAEEAQAEAQAALEKYNAQLAGGAVTEANAIREDARRRAPDRRRDARAGPGRGRPDHRERAQAQIEAERQQAVVQLRREVGRLSTDLASRIVGESLEDEMRQNGIVDRFLAELEAGDVKPEKVARRAESVGDAGSAGAPGRGRLMRGSSRGSARRSRQTFDSRAGRRRRPGPLAEELFAVTDVVDGSVSLRRAARRPLA